MFVISSNGNDNHQWQSLGGGQGRKLHGIGLVGLLA